MVPLRLDYFKHLPWIHKAGAVEFLFACFPVVLSPVGSLCKGGVTLSRFYFHFPNLPCESSGQEKCVAGGCFVLL